MNPGIVNSDTTEEYAPPSEGDDVFIQLAQKNLAVNRMNRELKAVSFAMSHDLQEPLRKIRNFLSLALTGNDDLDDNTRKYLQKSYTAAWHMQELLEDLVAYFKVKDAKDKFEKADLGEILNSAISEYDDKIRELRARIDRDKLGEAHVSHGQFRQLFHNLLSNSLKFVKEGRTPVICVKSETVQGDAKLNKRLRRKRQYYHIIYTDNGSGFDPQYNTRVFGLFQRLNSKHKYGGTGIGLAICKRIVENHEGIIVADGRMNEGARFDIYIPLPLERPKRREDANQGSRLRKANPPLR